MIVSPNHMHAPVARAYLEAGIDMICNKQLTARIGEMEALAALTERSGLVSTVTRNNTGFAMVRHAHELAASGALVELRTVRANYTQNWLTLLIETSTPTARSRRNGAPTRRAPGARPAWPTSASTPSARRILCRDSCRIRCWPTLTPSSRAGGSTTTPTCGRGRCRGSGPRSRSPWISWEACHALAPLIMAHSKGLRGSAC